MFSELSFTIVASLVDTKVLVYRVDARDGRKQRLAEALLRAGIAEHYGLSPLYSEDFQHDRLYGTVRVINPFL